jgi:hypothetical protein
MDFVRANAVLATGNHPDRNEPLIQAERRVFKDRSDLSGKLALGVCALALPFALLRKKRNVITSTSRTNDAIRPAASDQIRKAIIGIVEEYNRFLKCLWAFHTHDYTSGKLIRQVYYYPNL